MFPERRRFPDVTASYQSIVSPAPGLAVIVTVPVPHLEAPLAPVGADGTVLTVATIDVLDPVVHPLEVAST